MRPGRYARIPRQWIIEAWRDEDLVRCVRQVLCSTDNMRDLHIIETIVPEARAPHRTGGLRCIALPPKGFRVVAGSLLRAIQL